MPISTGATRSWSDARFQNPARELSSAAPRCWAGLIGRVLVPMRRVLRNDLPLWLRPWLMDQKQRRRGAGRVGKIAPSFAFAPGQHRGYWTCLMQSVKRGFVWRFAIGEAEQTIPRCSRPLAAPAAIYGACGWVHIAELVLPGPRFLSLVAMLRETGSTVSGWIVIIRTAQHSVALTRRRKPAMVGRSLRTQCAAWIGRDEKQSGGGMNIFLTCFTSPEHPSSTSASADIQSPDQVPFASRARPEVPPST